MRYNTLQMVNAILNALDLQPVSTLGETEDAEQVLALLGRVVTEVEEAANWHPKRTIVSLSTASGTNTTWATSYPDIPWAMAIPSGVEAVYEVYYGGKKIPPITPQEMLHRVEGGSAFTSTNAPSVWCMEFMDDNYVVFDSFDSSTENQLTSSNCKAYVTKYSQTDLSSDSTELGLSDKFFSTIMNRSLHLGFLEIIKNVSVADRYEKMYLNSKSALQALERKFKPHSFSLGEYDFSRKRMGGLYITDSQYNDVTS